MKSCVIQLVAISALAAPAFAQSTTRVSVDSAGNEANDDSGRPALSLDGRYVAFESAASDLVPGDTNGWADVFVHDSQTGLTTRVSISSTGSQGNAHCLCSTISSNGRYVAFFSRATNLVVGDTNATEDIFVHDRQTGQTTRVSVDSSGNQGNNSSPSNTGECPSVSSDGRYVAFGSSASNLVPGDANNTGDVFVHDRQTGVTTRVSLDSAGNEGNQSSCGPSMSGDGRYVAFASFSTNLVTADTNGALDVFVHDRQMGQTTRVSVDSSGNQGNSFSPSSVGESLSVTSDGRYVAFGSSASNLVPGDTNGTGDVFVHDQLMGQTLRVSVGAGGSQSNGNSGSPRIAAYAGCTVFESVASNLVAGDNNGMRDVFVHDLGTGQTARVSVDSAGNEASGSSDSSSIAGDGSSVAFRSCSTDLVVGDTNGDADVFVHERIDPVGTPFCFGDGSGIACPCGNFGIPGAGCADAVGGSGVLSASGSDSMAADDLGPNAVIPPGQPALLFVGTNALNGGFGVPFGDGLRCAGGIVVRLGIQTPNVSGIATWGPGLGATGGWAAGDTRYFQVWYRDPNGPCGSGFNLTNGVELLFGP